MTLEQDLAEAGYLNIRSGLSRKADRSHSGRLYSAQSVLETWRATYYSFQQRDKSGLEAGT